VFAVHTGHAVLILAASPSGCAVTGGERTA